MIKRTLPFFIILFVCFFAHGQTLMDNTTSEYLSKVKINFLVEEEMNMSRVNKIQDKKIKKEISETLTEFNNEFKNTIDNKKIFFHPEVSLLLDSIFKKIVNANPNYKIKDIQVLLGLDHSANAYNRGNKIVVVNFPLINQLYSEAQLAFIICHEIAHQELDHVFNTIFQNINKGNSAEMIQKTNQLKKTKYNKKELVRNEYKNYVYGNRRFKRTYEYQADSLGFILFQKAYPDHQNSAISALETIQYLDKETDSLTKEDYQLIFDHIKMPIKEQWFKNDELSSYHYQKSIKYWDIDSLRTHPEVSFRIEHLTKLFPFENDKKTEVDVKYHELKNKITFDELEVFYELKEYGFSLYRTMLALKNDLDNKRLNQLMFLNLDKMIALQKEYKLNQALQTVSPSNSSSYNNFLTLIRGMKLSELNQLKQLYEKNY